MCVLSLIQFFVSPWTLDCQASLSMGFFRQEYWNGLPFPTLGDLPDPGIEPTSLVSPALAGVVFINCIAILLYKNKVKLKLFKKSVVTSSVKTNHLD